ncbi:alcohol dehydrogenase catalytic domain-containing protein [Streptomyces decoyicus]
MRVTSCGLCGTDMHLLGGELPAAAYPLAPGHELTGEIVAVGAAVTGRAVGERVAVDPNMPCGACHYCRIGRGNLCEDYTAIGVTRAGGFAELAAVPARCCYVLPDSLSEAAAGLVEPLSCAVHGLGRRYQLPVLRRYDPAGVPLRAAAAAGDQGPQPGGDRTGPAARASGPAGSGRVCAGIVGLRQPLTPSPLEQP